MLKYDFIILGSGAAGLSLLMRMIASPDFSDKKILLIDKDAKNKNDRTWCFWENKKGFFEDVIYKKWDHLSFFGEGFSGDLDIHPYQYKMIRGIDLYEYCFSRIKQYSNIDIIHGEVKSVNVREQGVTIDLGDKELLCAPATVFNSFYKPAFPSSAKLNLLQHFKGWFIETSTPRFNQSQATLMDFRVHQRHGASFVYVLPFSHTMALVEYTLFTPAILEKDQYTTELNDYIKRFLMIEDFTITEEEFGTIPMTNETFLFSENGMYNIGIAGGQTKPSTGYTFQFIQKQSQAIVECLIKNKPLSYVSSPAKRFQFYDRVLLELLVTKKLEGREIFTRLFRRNKAPVIFKFLDNETSLLEEFKLISSLQTVPFLKAALRV